MPVHYIPIKVATEVAAEELVLKVPAVKEDRVLTAQLVQPVIVVVQPLVPLLVQRQAAVAAAAAAMQVLAGQVD
jgi:hypothetical protein